MANKYDDEYNDYNQSSTFNEYADDDEYTDEYEDEYTNNEIEYENRNKTNISKNNNKRLVYLSDLNDIIFVNMECNAFVLNAHKSEQSERILERINKIYDLLFDFFYETQLRNNKKKMGFGGRLNRHIIKSIVSKLNIDPQILDKFATIIQRSNLYINDYGRDEFNILFRLISMYENNVNESFMTFLDYQSMIVKLPPNIKIPNGFINYLNNRYPNWSINKYNNINIRNNSSIESSNSNREFAIKYKQTTEDTLINLNEFEFENNDNNKNEEIISYLFNYILKENECESDYIAQDIAVEILLSSKLNQEILEIIWNECKNDLVLGGLNEFEFKISLQLISLAQQSLPYNKYYLLSYKKIKYIPLPSILINIGFKQYYYKNIQSIANIQTNTNTNTNTNSSNIYERPLHKLIPYIPQSHIDNFMIYFNKLDRKKKRYLSGNVIGKFFRKSMLNESILAKVWDLSDLDNDGKLSKQEFCIAMHLINCVRQGAPLPNILPNSLTNNVFSHYGKYISHLNLNNVSMLKINDYIDYRNDNGKYTQMKIINIKNKYNLLLKYINNENNNNIYCNYKKQIYRIAKYKSITRRPITRSNMLKYKIGDKIDIKRQNSSSNCWVLGLITDFHFGQAQIQIINSNIIYWIHLDNTFECAPPNIYSNNKRKKSKQVKKKNSSKIKKKSQRKYSGNSGSHPSEKSSAGFVMINYPKTESNNNKNNNSNNNISHSTLTSHTHHTDKNINNINNKYHRPVIQFGGTETEKEVQHVLKTLNQSNRKHSYHAVNYINNNNNNNNNENNTKHRYYKSDNNYYSPNMDNRYSNTAPSTPIQITVKKYKYRSSRSNISKSNKHRSSRSNISKSNKPQSKKNKHFYV